MKSETRQCQNCKKDFIIDPEDFNFYEKIKVPPPTFCPWCRFIRRMSWRNERALYKRTCDLCKKSIIAMYDKDVPFPVYCRECWWNDKWDPVLYARPYDMNRNFFEQYKDFSNTVPRFAIWQRNSINSDYASMVGESRNVYLSYSIVDGSENVFYSKIIDKSMDIVDCLDIKEGQNLYEDIEGQKNYNCQNLLLSRNCLDSCFLVDCVNCSNCMLSHNLRNKEFYIRNKKHTKEKYLEELEKFNLGSRGFRESLLREFTEIKRTTIYRFANILRSINSTGNNLLNTRNCLDCFDVYDSENIKYGYRLLNSFKDSMDTAQAIKSELMYEYITGARNDYNVKFSISALNSVRNAEYTDSCVDCNNIFGCVSLKKKENAIFNQVYSKEEFTKLRKKIIQQMEDIPFIDKAGRIYKYGEFFPIELSPWAYNETVAQEIEPITKMEAEKNGYSWHEPNEKKYSVTMSFNSIPDNIEDVNEEILNEVLECEHDMKCDHQCLKVFKILPYELQFYKKNNIPIPNKCPNCRYYERFSQMLPQKLWHRKCMKEGCKNEFETSYAPDRPEIIYCESCYNREVY
jgi:hypothetical protein